MKMLKSTKIQTPSGITLDCVEQGDPQAPALLLVHGYSDSWRAFGPLLTEIPETQRVIAVTLRGHGNSDRPETGYGIGDFAADLRAVLDSHGLASAAVVGHSMGSMVAVRLALDHPDRVHALVLIGALATLKGNAAIDDEFCEAVEAITDPVDPDLVREFQESTLARPVPRDFLDTVVEESLKVPARVWREALHAMLDEDLSPDLYRLSVPTLMLWGNEDCVCDRASQIRLADAIPGARLSVLADAGHAPHWEDPRHITTAIASFLDAARAAA